METVNVLEAPSFPPLHATTAASVLCATVVTAALCGIFLNRRHWFLRPSLIVLVIYHIRFQWPSLLLLSTASQHLRKVWDFVLIVHGFPLVFLAVAIPIFIRGDGLTLLIWQTMKKQVLGGTVWRHRYTLAPLLFTAITLVFYFSILPFSATGLYALFTDPLSLRDAREESWKLLPSQLLRYLFSWNYNTFAPLLLVGATVSFRQVRRLPPRILCVLVCAVGLFSMSLSGSRGGIANGVLVILLSYLLLRLKWPRPITILLGMVLVALGPAYVTLKREGTDFTLSNYSGYMERIIVYRMFVAPSYTALLYTYHAQEEGFYGISGMRPLAALAGVPHEDIASEIGQAYFGGAGSTSHCNTNFVGAYYSMFGLFTIPISVTGLLFFDLFLLAPRIRRVSVLPILVLFVVKGLLVSEGGFTSTLFTGGYWLLPIVALFLRSPASRLGQLPLQTNDRNISLEQNARA